MTTKAIREMFQRWQDGYAHNEDSVADYALMMAVSLELEAIEHPGAYRYRIQSAITGKPSEWYPGKGEAFSGAVGYEVERING